MHLPGLPTKPIRVSGSTGCEAVCSFKHPGGLDVGDPEIKCSTNLTPLWYIHTKKLYSALEREELQVLSTTAEFQTHYTEGKKPDSGGLYDPFM